MPTGVSLLSQMGGSCRDFPPLFVVRWATVLYFPFFPPRSPDRFSFSFPSKLSEFFSFPFGTPLLFSLSGLVFDALFWVFVHRRAVLPFWPPDPFFLFSIEHDPKYSLFFFASVLVPPRPWSFLFPFPFTGTFGVCLQVTLSIVPMLGGSRHTFYPLSLFYWPLVIFLHTPFFRKASRSPPSPGVNLLSFQFFFARDGDDRLFFPSLRSLHRGFHFLLFSQDWRLASRSRPRPTSPHVPFFSSSLSALSTYILLILTEESV